MSSDNSSVQYVSSGVSLFSFGILFLTAGLVMRDICDGQTDLICQRVYENGDALMITGSVFIGLPFAIILLVVMLVWCSNLTSSSDV